MRFWAVIVGLFLLTAADLLWTTVFAADGNRVALVVGNSKYVYAPTLANPASDARLMAETLRQAGFKVVEGIDLDYAGMQDRLNRFTEASYDAELAVIYYAGHGMQVNGKNYLVPVDAELTAPAHLRTRTIQIDELLDALPPDPGVGVVILDACRDNPLARTLAASLPKSRSTTAPGLAPVEIASTDVGTGGVLIAYATDPGAVSYDGTGVNSPYTTSLARHLAEPGVDIQSALTRVRGEVTAETKGRQRPWHNASLGREVFIGPETPATAPPSPQAPGAATADQPAGTDSRAWEVEQRVWDEASKRNTIAHYEAYLQQFPNGSFAGLARLNIDQLKQPKQQTVAAADPNAVSRSSAPAPSVEPDTGTEISEATLGLDTAGRLDLQLRLQALGYELGDMDGTFGPRTRRAIADWQKTNGLSPSTFFTLKQRDQLIAETEALMQVARAKAITEKAAAEQAAEPPAAQPPAPRAAQAPKPDQAARTERKKIARKSKPRLEAPAVAEREKPAKKQGGRYKICRTVRDTFQIPANELCSPGL